MGKCLIEQKKYKEAKENINIALNLLNNDTFIKYNFAFGKAFLREKQYDDAIYYLTQADLKAEHESLKEIEYISLSFTLLQLGNAYYGRSNNEEDIKMAIEYYRQLIDSPCKEKLNTRESIENVVLSYYNTAEILFKKKDKIEDAKALLEEAINFWDTKEEISNSTKWNTYNFLGTVYQTLKNPEDAIKNFEKTLTHFNKREKPENSDNNTLAIIYQNIGKSQSFSHQYEEAQKSYEKGVKEKPDDTTLASIYVELGKNEYKRQFYNNAIEYYNQALKYYIQVFAKNECNSSSIIYTYIKLGQAYFVQKKYEQCIRILEEMVNRSTKDNSTLKVYPLIILCYIRLQRCEDYKLKDYLDAIMNDISIKNDNIQWFNIAVVYRLLGDKFLKDPQNINKENPYYSNAKKILDKITEETPEHFQAWNALGTIARREGQFNQAMQYYGNAIESYKTNKKNAQYATAVFNKAKTQIKIIKNENKRQLIEDVENEFNNFLSENSFCKFSFQVYKELRNIYNHAGDHSKMHDLLNRTMKHDMAFFLEPNTIKSNQINFPQKLYKYTAANSEGIFNFDNPLWMSHPNNFNDPNDPIIKTLTTNIYKYVELKNLLDNVKIASLTTNHKNTLMWGHYANNHKGICIEYDTNSFFSLSKEFLLLPVDYNSTIRLDNDNDGDEITMQNIITDDKVGQDESLFMKNNDFKLIDIFFKKQADWKYEKEYRLLYYDRIKRENDENTKEKQKIKKELSNLKITGIYLGINCPENIIDYIKKCIKDKDIELHQLINNKHNLFEFDTEKIF